MMKKAGRITAQTPQRRARKEKNMGYFTYQIPFSQTEYEETLTHCHFQREDIQECAQVWQDIVTWETGAGKESRNDWIKAWYRYESEKELLVIMTLGAQYDEVIAHYEQNGELLKAYAADCLAMAVLKKGYAMFSDALYQCEKKYPGEFHFLEDEQMKRVPGVLSDMGITEVFCNEAFVMVPQKTVVFLTEMSDKKSEDCAEICENCTRRTCARKTCTRETSIWRETDKVEQWKQCGYSGLNYGYRQILGTDSGK